MVSCARRRRVPHCTHVCGAAQAHSLGAMKDAAAVMAGGAAGTLARAGLHEALPVTPGTWPWATLIANVAGTLLLGWLVAAVGGRAVAPARRAPASAAR